jgi:hypothetical protein
MELTFDSVRPYSNIESLFIAIRHRSDTDICEFETYEDHTGEEKQALRIDKYNNSDERYEIVVSEDQGIIEHGGVGATYFDPDDVVYQLGWDAALELNRIAVSGDVVSWSTTLPISKMQDPPDVSD